MAYYPPPPSDNDPMPPHAQYHPQNASRQNDNNGNQHHQRHHQCISIPTPNRENIGWNDDNVLLGYNRPLGNTNMNEKHNHHCSQQRSDIPSNNYFLHFHPGSGTTRSKRPAGTTKSKKISSHHSNHADRSSPTTPSSPPQVSAQTTTGDDSSLCSTASFDPDCDPGLFSDHIQNVNSYIDSVRIAALNRALEDVDIFWYVGTGTEVAQFAVCSLQLAVVSAKKRT